MPAALVVLVLALLLGMQPITTDLYLPALPGLTQELGASMGQAQKTLTALLLAFGASQLLWGPLSDRFGRKPILIAGLVAYVVASVGSAFAASMDLLIVWRTLQGAAMGAAVMGARAIVRDLYTPLQAASVMSKGLSGLGVIACLSAPVGGLLAAWLNWHAALLALAVFGALTLGVIVLRFEETVPHKNPDAMRPATLAQTWVHILSTPAFWAFTALSTFAYSGLFVFLAASSFVYMRVLGLNTLQYGVLMFVNSFVYILGTFLCRRLLSNLGVRRTVAVGGGLSLAGGGGVLAFALAGWVSPWTLEGPFLLFMLGHGIHNPCGQSGAVAPFPRSAGAASALNGFLAMVSAFATGLWLGAHMDGTIWPLVNGIAFWSLMIALTAWSLVQRYGRH